MKAKSTILALTVAIVALCTAGSASAQFPSVPGLKQLDPFNKNSQVRERLRTVDKARRAEGRNLANGYKRAHGVPNPLNQNSTQFRGHNRTSTNNKFRYTIENRTRATVRFRLPSGKVYTLRPNQRGSYTFSGSITKARIQVYNSGRTYSLRPAAYRFFTMSNGRVGFTSGSSVRRQMNKQVTPRPVPVHSNLPFSIR